MPTHTHTHALTANLKGLIHCIAAGVYLFDNQRGIISDSETHAHAAENTHIKTYTNIVCISSFSHIKSSAS